MIKEQDSSYGFKDMLQFESFTAQENKQTKDSTLYGKEYINFPVCHEVPRVGSLCIVSESSVSMCTICSYSSRA